MTQIRMVANLAASSRRETFRGREHIVFPVVMLRETVVNGGFVEKASLLPWTWNGTPVTVHHPEDASGTITANSPQTLEQWAIGTIFNATLDGDKLKAEAWIDVELAEALSPGLIETLEGGDPMDVSTGFYSTLVKKSGRHNGKSYTQVHTELKPDHLALLPGDVGACSWQDGCGVRTNSKGEPMDGKEDDEAKGILALLGFKKRPQANRRGDAGDRRQIIADLISDDRSPFVPDDMYSLMEMSQESLTHLRDQYLTAEGEPTTNAKGDTPVSCKDQNGATPAPAPAALTAEAVSALVANALKEALPAAVTEAVKGQLEAQRAADLVAKLAANKDLGFTEDELKAMPLTALQKLDAKAAEPKAPVAPVANFGGRAARTVPASGGAEPRRFPGMVVNNVAPAETTAGDKQKEA